MQQAAISVAVVAPMLELVLLDKYAVVSSKKGQEKYAGHNFHKQLCITAYYTVKGRK